MQLLNVGNKNNRAFTMIELMVVVVISAFFITALIPGYESMVRNNQASVAAARLASSLNLAKSEAIKRGIPVTVCPISSTFNPTSAPNETTEEWPCQATTTWDAWKVFADPNFDAVEDFSAGWPVIQYVGNNQPGSVVSNISGPITFDPMGFANIDPASTRSGWTWANSYSSGEWSWGYSYNSAYAGSYYRVFTIEPIGCSGKNAKSVAITQNGVITTTNVDC